MANNELISVIIPVYNRADYIKRGVDSVLAQKDVNFELILVDDGSTDSSPEIIDEYAKKYSNVIAFHQKNVGVSAARNKGIEICNGDYVFFLDSDDYIVEGALYKLLQCIHESGADMSVGVYSRFWEDGSLEYEHTIPAKLKNRLLNKKEYLSLMYIENSYLWSMSPGKLMKRHIFDNIKFSVGLVSEDELITPKLMEAVNGIYLLDEVLYHQVLSKVSIIRSKMSVRRLDATYAVLVMLDYLIEQEYFDMALFRFGIGTRLLMKWKKESDDKEIQAIIKKQYRMYCQKAKMLIPYVSFNEKIRLILFQINFDLYGIVRNIVKKDAYI